MLRVRDASMASELKTTDCLQMNRRTYIHMYVYNLRVGTSGNNMHIRIINAYKYYICI